MRFLKINDGQYVNTDRIESVQVVMLTHQAGEQEKHEVQVRTLEEYYVAAVLNSKRQAEVLAQELVTSLEGNLSRSGSVKTEDTETT